MRKGFFWYVLASVWFAAVFLWGYILGVVSWFSLQTWSFVVWMVYMSLVLPCVFCLGYDLRSRGLLLEYLEKEAVSVWLKRDIVVMGAFGGMVLALIAQNFLVLWWMCVFLIAIFFLPMKWWNYVPWWAMVFLIGQQLSLENLWLPKMWLPLIFVCLASLVLMWARTAIWLRWIMIISIICVIWEIGGKMTRLL